MPDYLSVLAVEPNLDDVPLGDQDQTYERLRSWVEDRSGVWKEPVRVLFESPWEAASLGVFIAEDGEVDEDFSALSLDAKKAVPSSATVSPALRLTGDVGEFADALVEATGDGDATFETEGDTLTLPFLWESAERLVTVMQVIAPRLVAAKVAAIVSIDGALAQLTVQRKKGVRVDPIFYWFADKAARTLAQRFNRAVSVETVAPISGDGVAVLADALQEKGDRIGVALVEQPQGNTPLTSGSAKARLNRSWDASPDQLLAALGAPENAGERFERVRLEILGQLARQHPPGMLALLIERLKVESDAVRAQMYSALTGFEEPDAWAALAAAFENDSANAAFIATLVWRQRGVVDLLVARLVSVWATDKRLAKRILAMLREEYIAVKPDQVRAASPELRAALAGLIKP